MRKIESIQALRAVAAICVVLSHMSFINGGAFGVDIFFVISGFLMMHSTENGLNGYWKRKISRLIPFYWIMTIFTALAIKIAPELFNSYEASWMYMLKSLLFIPYEHSGIRHPILGLGYTLNFEMLFYLLFYASAKIAQRSNVYGGRGIICSVAIFLLVGFGGVNPPMPFAFWCSTRIVDFVLGIMLYYLFMQIKLDSWLETDGKLRNYICGVLAICFMAWLWYPHLIEENTMWLMWGVPSALLFVVVYIFCYGKSVPTILLLIGNSSYYIYLIHMYCVRLIERVSIPILGNEVLSRCAIAFAGVFLSVLCGHYACYFWFVTEKCLVKKFNNQIY